MCTCESIESVKAYMYLSKIGLENEAAAAAHLNNINKCLILDDRFVVIMTL